MKISYNPSGSALNQSTPAASDIIFDLHSLDIWARGVKIVGNTVTSSLKGLVPNFGTDATGTIDNQANDWVLTKNDDETIGWYKLPVNAFNNTQYDVFTGATSSTDGTIGLVKQPLKADIGKFLKGDGTWSALNTSNITLASYSIATTAENLADDNTLNQALGKLEYKANSAYNWILGVTSEDTDGYINKWQEIVEFIKNAQNTDADGNPTDILDEFVTRKTPQTITGLKSFSRTLKMIPTTSGTNATGFLYVDSAGTNENTCTSGIGSFFRNGVYEFSYIGWGAQPYNGSSCLKINSTALTYQNQSILHSGNYTDYTVKKDGTGATGTWDISITGNAETATSLSSWTVTSSTDTKRYVWMSYNDNSGRACYDSDLTYQTSTDTLYTKNIKALGNLEVGNTDANHTLALKGSTSQLKLFAWTDSTYIESGTYNFGENIPLRITGISGNTGSDLYLNFTNIYCRGNTYTNLDSGNYQNYIKILANYFSTRPTTCNYLYGDGSLRHFKATDTMTTSKPPSDAHVLHFAWDNNKGWESQLAISASDTPTVYIRGQDEGTWSNWITLLSSDNYTNYTHNRITSLGYIPAKTLAGDSAYPSGLSTHGIRYVAADQAQEPKYPFSYGCAITAKSYNGSGTGVFQIVGQWNDAQTATNNDVPTGVSVRSRRDNMSAWTTWTHLITSRNIGNQSVNSAKYLLTQNKDNTNFYSDTYEAYLKWESSDTAAFKFNDGTFKFRADLATKADGAYYVFDYNSTTTPIYIGYAGTSLTSSTANYLAAYGTTSAGKRCIKDISGAETKKFIGLGNVQNTAFYKRSTTVNGTAWDMAGTVNSAAFTIYAPTTAGTSGQVLISTGGVPTWTNQSNLSAGKLGTTTVGGTGRPIYLNAGAPTAITVSGTTTTLYIAGVASSTGNICTGTQSESGVRIYGGNKLYAYGGFYESSDECLKDFYDDIKIDFEKLSKLPKKYFKWKQDQSHLNIGTSAQELQKLYPELVNTDDDGILHVAYDKLSIIALKGIDILYEKIKQLNLEISELKQLYKQYGKIY